MKNKKKLIFIILGIAVIVFIGLYAIINYSEPNILDSSDKKWIANNGGKVISAISSKVTYLINNDVESTSTKNKKAKELGIKIISEQELLDMVGK